MILLAYLAIGIFQEMGVIPTFMPFSDMFYSLLASCLFSAFLAYHTKLIVAGKHSKYRMNEQDYVFGAMALYNDIVNIFLHILKIIGQDKRSD
jgi:FtsH-binding integral membrane protein